MGRVSNRINASDMPDGFLSLGTKAILTIPVLTIIALVVLGGGRLLPAHRARRP